MREIGRPVCSDNEGGGEQTAILYVKYEFAGCKYEIE